jgi:hypothetical protein
MAPTGGLAWTPTTALTSYFGPLGSPRRLIVEPGQSLYVRAAWFVCGVYACTTFDRVKISLPSTSSFADFSFADTLDPSTLTVGPVTAAP